MLYRLIPVLPALLLTLTPALATPPVLDRSTRDWATVATDAASEQLPIVLLISSGECGYCERLKQEVLYPMVRSGGLEGRAIVREMERHSGGKVVDFDGEKIRTCLFLGRYEVFATPTVLFLDPLGRPLHEPLVGFNGDARYRPLLEQAIRESTSLLREVGNASGKMAAGSP